jgi:hypothetical protein
MVRASTRIQILYVGRAHTRGDSIVFVPQDRIVYLSELYFADQFLFINDGYGLDWLRALDTVEALGADIFVPGHGPIPADPRETREGLRRFRQMLVDVRDAVQKEIARGATEDQAVAAIRWPQYEKNAGIQHATGDGRAAAVSATGRQAPIRQVLKGVRTLPGDGSNLESVGVDKSKRPVYCSLLLLFVLVKACKAR